MRWYKKPLNYRTYRYSVTLIFIAINVAVFLLVSMYRPLHSVLALNPNNFLSGYYWTVLSYMFDHASFTHLLFNMLALYFFGSVVERVWGANEYILLYLLIGIVSGALSLVVYLFNGSSYVFLLGASGAVYGVMLIFACLYPRHNIYIFGVFPLQARIVMLIFIGIETFSAFTSPNKGIAFNTHLFGIGIAWLYLLLRHGINPRYKLFS